VPDSLLLSINNYAETKISSHESREFILPEKIVFQEDNESLENFTSDCIKKFLLYFENTTVEKIEFETFWVVSQYSDTSSPVHFHSGDISGVMYLKLPEIDTRELDKSYISGRNAGYINFINGGKQRLSKSLISFEPKIGDYYIFPGWLLHGVEPFKGTGERRSLAFNAYIT
jgi:hypothetical protein